jgi:hypothetical protein
MSNDGTIRWRQASAPAVEPGVPSGGMDVRNPESSGCLQFNYDQSERQDAARYDRRDARRHTGA